MIQYDKIKTLDNALRELLAVEYEHQTGMKDAEFIRLTEEPFIKPPSLARLMGCK